MTTYKKYLKTGILAALFTIFSSFGNNASAQRIPDELNFKLDWQLNAPVGSDFVNGMTGWGMNFETAYEVYGPWSLGAFASFHTNHGYDERRTIQLSPTQTLNTDLTLSSFQIPFGGLVSYTLFDNGYFKPYITTKLGAMYQQNTAYMNYSGYYNRPWGFYVSPEIGVTIHPLKYSRFGFNVVAYYSYGTNQNELLDYSENGVNNLGFRLGVCF